MQKLLLHRKESLPVNDREAEDMVTPARETSNGCLCSGSTVSPFVQSKPSRHLRHLPGNDQQRMQQPQSNATPHHLCSSTCKCIARSLHVVLGMLMSCAAVSLHEYATLNLRMLKYLPS